MSSIRRLTVGLGVTVKPRDYNSFRVDVEAEVKLDFGDDPDEVVTETRKWLSEKLESGIEVEVRNLYGDAAVERVLQDMPDKVEQKG